MPNRSAAGPALLPATNVKPEQSAAPIMNAAGHDPARESVLLRAAQPARSSACSASSSWIACSPIPSSACSHCRRERPARHRARHGDRCRPRARGSACASVACAARLRRQASGSSWRYPCSSLSVHCRQLAHSCKPLTRRNRLPIAEKLGRKEIQSRRKKDHRPVSRKQPANSIDKRAPDPRYFLWRHR
jgi:hypothetical protein